MYAVTLQSDNNEVDVDDSSEPNQSNPNASTSSSSVLNVQNEDDRAGTDNASQPQETQQIQAISASDAGSSGSSTPSTWRGQAGQAPRPQQVFFFVKANNDEFLLILLFNFKKPDIYSVNPNSTKFTIASIDTEHSTATATATNYVKL